MTRSHALRFVTPCELLLLPCHETVASTWMTSVTLVATGCGCPAAVYQGGAVGLVWVSPSLLLFPSSLTAPTNNHGRHQEGRYVRQLSCPLLTTSGCNCKPEKGPCPCTNGGCGCKTNKCKCQGCPGRVRAAGRHTSSSSSDSDDDDNMKRRRADKRAQRAQMAAAGGAAGQPGMGQAGMAQPGMGQPGMGQPGMGQPGVGGQRGQF